MFAPITAHLKAAAAVTAILGAGDQIRVYKSGNAPQDTQKPYTVLQSSLAPENGLDGAAGHDRDSVQLDAYAKEERQAEILADACRKALEGHCYFTGTIFNGRDTDTKLFRIGLQFDYFVDRA